MAKTLSLRLSTKAVKQLPVEYDCFSFPTSILYRPGPRMSSNFCPLQKNFQIFLAVTFLSPNLYFCQHSIQSSLESIHAKLNIAKFSSKASTMPNNSGSQYPPAFSCPSAHISYVFIVSHLNISDCPHSSSQSIINSPSRLIPFLDRIEERLLPH